MASKGRKPDADRPSVAAILADWRERHAPSPVRREWPDHEVADAVRRRASALMAGLEKSFVFVTGKAVDVLRRGSVENTWFEDPATSMSLHEHSLRLAYDFCSDALERVRWSELHSAWASLAEAERWAGFADGIRHSKKPDVTTRDAMQRLAKERHKASPQHPAKLLVYSVWLSRQPFKRGDATKLADEMLLHFSNAAPADRDPVLTNAQNMTQWFGKWKKGKDIPE